MEKRGILSSRPLIILLAAALVLLASGGHAGLLSDVPGQSGRPTAVQIEQIQAAAPVVDRLFRDHAAGRHMPGLAWGVVLDGRLLLSGGCGYADLENRLPATPQTLFRAASMSKSFTAMAILQLRDAGRLRLDDPAALYLPEMEKLRYLTADAPPITIRDLLTHGAGFPEDNPWGDRQLERSDAELRRLLPAASMANAPGVAYEYSNLGFALLGQIVQTVSGMDFQEYTREYIFKPLGMTATLWEYSQAPPAQLARGYERRGEDFAAVPLLHHGAYGAMGGLITTVEDFSRYMLLHLSAWPPRDDPEPGVLARHSLREMHHPWRFYSLTSSTPLADGAPCPVVNAYAYGLRWQRDCRERTWIGHTGGLPGFGCQWMILPDYGLGVVSFDNLTYGTTPAINKRVLDTLIVLAGLQPREKPVSAILERRQGELLRLLPEWQPAAALEIFAENFFLDRPLAEWLGESRRLFAAAGRIIAVSRIKAENNLRGTFLIEGERQDIACFFTLSPEPEPRIQELRLTLEDK